MALALSLISIPKLLSILVLVLGFGFVIFWHELGHFLAAKWVGIKVDQFAVGFGHAVFSWRKGIGFRMGNTQTQYRERIEEHLKAKRRATPDAENAEFTDAEVSAAALELGLGDTEYRLNWIPLGGYVKMLGQDDLKPDALAEDPRAYNKKSISARMLVISAGVIMNIILAAIGFMILFRVAFNVAPAWAGNVIPGSPAAKAGLVVGDHIAKFDGKLQQDFTKITLNTALVAANEKITMEIDRPVNPEDPNCKEFKHLKFEVVPAMANGDKGFLQIGFSPPAFLQGPKKEEGDTINRDEVLQHYPADALQIGPGDVITAINGQPVVTKDYVKFYDILQASYGKPVMLTVRDAAGKERTEKLQPRFEEPFGEPPFYAPFNLAGMVPRTAIQQIMDKSPVLGKIKPMDVVVAIKDFSPLFNPSHQQLLDRLREAGKDGRTMEIDVLRQTADGEKTIAVPDVKATAKLEDHRGLGVGLILDETHPVIATIVDKNILPNNPAAAAQLQPGDRLTKITTTIDNVEHATAIDTWFDVHRALAGPEIPATGATFSVEYLRNGAPGKCDLTMDAVQMATIREVKYCAPFLQLTEYIEPRKTDSLLTAASWGVSETRDFILQFYVTLRRMASGSVSPSNMMGPVGIFYAGGRFAFKGYDWLLWFLAMISANLAVVNFLPIPVVDGGQFLFLILEKIKGKPLSPRAMAIAQYCGLAFLAAVVLFVTYHDIMRFF